MKAVKSTLLTISRSNATLSTNATMSIKWHQEFTFEIPEKNRKNGKFPKAFLIDMTKGNKVIVLKKHDNYKKLKNALTSLKHNQGGMRDKTPFECVVSEDGMNIGLLIDHCTPYRPSPTKNEMPESIIFQGTVSTVYVGNRKDIVSHKYFDHKVVGMITL